MNRSEYRTHRRAVRAKRPTREGAGLPRHPDGSGYCDCATCEGAGEFTHNDSCIGDPQLEYTVRCVRCNGAGVIRDGHRDPILDLRGARILRRMGRPRDAYRYGATIARAFSPAVLP